MARAVLAVMGIVAMAAASIWAAAPYPEPVTAQRALRASVPLVKSAPATIAPRQVLDTYCVTCHNDKRKTAGLSLETLDVAQVSAAAEIWEHVLQKVRTQAMPPPGMPRPEKATYRALASYLETALDEAAAAHPDPGRPAVHRLNRAEYANAIRDLLAVDISMIDVAGGSLLPADVSGYGFDNIADALSVTPVLLKRYLSAAEKISHLASGDPTMAPVFETYKLPKFSMQENRTSEELPFGSRGGVSVHHYFPLDGEYVLKIGLQRNTYNYIKGIGEAHQIDVRVDGARVKVFTIGGERRGRSGPIFLSNNTFGDPAQEEYEQQADSVLEVRFPAKAGPRPVSVTFINRTWEPTGILQSRLRGLIWELNKGGDQRVATVTIGGPFNPTGTGDTPSRRQIFVCRPVSARDEMPCGRKIFSTLARRAYRRPVTESDLRPLLGSFEAGRREGGFETGVVWALKRLLVSPAFLFRIEADPANAAPGTVYRLSDLELASRLSFFLWSSLPDEELLEVAERGKLKEPAVLEYQVRRLLEDPRAQALVSNFAGQWLYLRNMKGVIPDPITFPDFDEDLREGLQRETELFFESQLRDDRPVLELLSANYTFLNERLARHYNIPNVYGGHFRRVTVPEERAGLLGQGSVLTVTSYATRTSPVLRGKWLLDNLLGAPPPPPPANVPALKENNEGGTPRSVRERMEQHRKNPACASCHARMDPLGFALDNFDAIGRWRTLSEGNTPIDASGALPDGSKFQGPVELRKLFLTRDEELVTTVTEKLLTYALGRGVEYYDGPAIRKIVRDAAPNDYRWSSIIRGIVKSLPFQMRVAREARSPNASSQMRRLQ